MPRGVWHLDDPDYPALGPRARGTCGRARRQAERAEEEALVATWLAEHRPWWYRWCHITSRRTNALVRNTRSGSSSIAHVRSKSASLPVAAAMRILASINVRINVSPRSANPLCAVQPFPERCHPNPGEDAHSQ